jgi:hypothetical protein
VHNPARPDLHDDEDVQHTEPKPSLQPENHTPEWIAHGFGQTSAQCCEDVLRVLRSSSDGQWARTVRGDT